MSNIAKAYVQVIPSAKGIKGQLSGIFGSEGSAAGTSFGTSLINKVKGLIAAAGIGKAFSDALMTGSDLEQLKGGVQKIFNDMDTSTIMADAANAYKDLNMSANQYLATINDVGATFAATMGDEKGYSVARTGLQAISDYASGTGKSVDLLSEKFTMITRSTSSYQSIADQFSGILPATSAGFLEQAQAAGLLSGQYRKLTEVPIAEYQQAVAEMLKKGTAELGLAGNTAAETATTFAGSLAAMKAAYSNFIGALATGEDIGPALNALSETVFTFISGNLMPMIGNILSELPTVLNSAFSMAIRGLNLVANNAGTIVQMGIDLVTGIGTAIISAAPYLLDAAINVVSALGNALLNADWESIGNATINALRNNLNIAAGEIIGTDGNIINAVLTAITTYLPRLVTGGINIVTKVIDGILQSAPKLISAAGQIMEYLIDALLKALPTILAAGMSLIEKLAEGLINNLPAIIAAIATVLSRLIAAILEHLPQIIQTGILLLAQLAVGFIMAIPQIIAAIPSIINSVKNAFRNVNWGEIGISIIQGIAYGILAGVSLIISAAQYVAQAAFYAAKRALGIASPSKVMRDQVGKFIPEGIAVGIEANTKPLQDAMHDLSGIATDTMQTDLSIANTATMAATADRSGTNNDFRALLDKLERINERLSNIKIVMDTGALVGEIVDPIDKALGNMQMLSARGV